MCICEHIVGKENLPVHSKYNDSICILHFYPFELMVDNGNNFSLKIGAAPTTFLLGLLGSKKVFYENKALPRLIELEEDIDYVCRQEVEKLCKK